MTIQNDISDMIRESVRRSIKDFSPKDAVDSKMHYHVWTIVYCSTCEPVWNVIRDYEHYIKQHIPS